MELEVRSLKQELVQTREALKSATKRCRELVRELDSVTTCHESERNLRDEQLARILRALLVLESRLKQEQKSIRQQLCEKDTVIRNQQLEISKLRRYTKNYIKNKRELAAGKNCLENCVSTEVPDRAEPQLKYSDGYLSKDIQRLKREIISKLNEETHGKDCSVKKTNSFAGSDISKDSLTSEATDASIVTTTTEGSPSLVSTEGFCEGESSDMSPVSTLNKSSRCTTSESDSESTRITANGRESQSLFKRPLGLTRSEPLELYESEGRLSRSESKDDGMDCNFASDEEDTEPIYANACSENNAKNLRENEGQSFAENFINNNEPTKLGQEERSIEDTSGNWYSDPDEDRISDEICRNNSYRPNSNHNSVLECVNQILLRDMDEEENILSVPRIFKHRGRIVRFQPARLSDIESVGSEIERRNSDEKDPDVKIDEAGSEDEFGMRLLPDTSAVSRLASAESVGGSESGAEEDLENPPSTGAIPIIIIEPKEDLDAQSDVSLTSPQLSHRPPNRPSSPILRLERIEEKTCLSMSSKGLTIAKNLDYEDIESLPEIVSPPPKTPPALPPKPQFRNNTLILKKIPSPSFLIDETRKKHNYNSNTPGYVKRIFGMSSTTSPKLSIGSSSRSLVFVDDKLNKSPGFNNNIRDVIKQSPSVNNNRGIPLGDKAPRVTNIVRHFEEFKIGSEITNNARNRTKERRPPPELEELDIRQNFEEFNLDDCDLSNDPDRPDGDGSERLNSSSILAKPDNDSSFNLENKNASYVNNNSNGIYDHFLEATGLSTKSILTPSRLLSNHKSMLKPKDIKYKSKIKAVGTEKHNNISGSGGGDLLTASGNAHTHIKHWTGPFV